MKELIALFFGIVFAAVALALLLALPTMWLWNANIPALFALPSITWGQAFGLMLLARLLFGTGNSSSSKK